MLLIDFDTLEKRKRFFWICFAISLVMVAGGMVLVCLTQRGRELVDSLTSISIMALIWTLVVVCGVRWPKQMNNGYTLRFESGKLRFVKKHFVEDPEGLRYSGYGPVLLFLDLFSVLCILSEYVTQGVLSTILLVFSFVCCLVGLVLFCLTESHINKYYLVFGLLLASVPLQAQDVRSYTRIVKELSSAKYQGRAYAQNGVVLAGDYLEKAFREAGADTVFRQSFEMDINTFPGKMSMVADGRKLRAGEDFVMREYSPGVHGSFKLYRIDTLRYNIDSILADLEKPEHRGALVVCDFWFPYRHRDFRKLEQVAAGNAGFIFTWNSPLKFYKAYGQKVVEKPVIWTTEEALRGAESVTLDIDHRFMTHVESSNIVARVEGRRHDSCYVFTAHYDHLGNIGSKIYCPGVNDNASGTAAIVTLAAYYAQHQPDFDLWFVAFAGEETGLNGSTYFCDHPAVPLTQIKYLFNLDMIGDNNPVQYCEVSEAGMEGFHLLRRLNSEQGCFDSLQRGELAGNSDHYPFAQRGVPCILFEQQEGDYFQYYHTPKDDMRHFCSESYPKLFRLLTEYVKACSTPVAVDFHEGVELMALVWRLLGDRPYALNTYPEYCESADRYFASFKEHPVVAKALEAAQKEGIGYDAVASYGLHLIISPEGHITFDNNLRKGSDPSFERWSEGMGKEFLTLLEDFYQKSQFHQWYLSTQPLRNNALAAFSGIVRQFDIRWYEQFFGPQPQGSQFAIVLSILCGQNNYGCSATMKNGAARVTPVISCCQPDREGNPHYASDMVIPIIVHEFCHPYCNPLDAKHWKKMERNASEVFELHREELSRMAYPDAKIMLDESFVRACVIRYQLQHDASANKDVLVAEPQRMGFLLVPDLVMALDRYEHQRDKYATMGDYMAEIVNEVNRYDVQIVRRQMEEEASKQATYTCNIQDGATEVPSGEYAIVITFSKPMQGGVSLGFGRGDGKFPALGRGRASVNWDESMTVQTIFVRLEPGTTYAFSINGPNYKTADGHTAKAIQDITFTTQNK